MYLQPVLNLLNPGHPLLGLPVALSWKPEIGNAPPADLAVTRLGEKNILTTNNGTILGYQVARSGEVTFEGERRIENVLPDSPDDWNTNSSAGAGSDPVITEAFADGPFGEPNSAVRCQLATGGTSSGDQSFIRHDGSISGIFYNQTSSFWLKLNTGSVAELQIRAGESNAFVDVTDEWQFVYQTSQTQVLNRPRAAITARGDRVGDTTVDLLVAYALARGPQLQPIALTTSDVASSEDVKSDVVYNSGVAGVAYFGTSNKNTGAGNIVTEVASAAIVGGGYNPENAETQLLATAAIRDLTDAAWTPTNITPVQDALGIDGALEATTLTATGALGTIFATFVLGSSDYTYTVFVARETGTGTVEFTIDGGTTWVDITSSLTSDIVNRFTVTQTLANPSIGFRITTSGDEIVVDFANLVDNKFASSPISVAGARVADTNAGPAWPTEHSALVDVTVADVANADDRTVLLGMDGSEAFFLTTSNAIRLLADGVSAVATAATSYEGERHKFAFSSSTADGHLVVDDEGNSATDLSGNPGEGTILVGFRSDGDRQWRGRIHEITVWAAPQPLSELENRVT